MSTPFSCPPPLSFGLDILRCFLCDFLGAHRLFLETGLGGGQRGALCRHRADSGRETWTKSAPPSSR